MKRIAVLSRVEHESAIFRALYPEVFSDFDKIVVFQDLQSEERIRYPVSRLLHRHQGLLAEVEGFDHVLSTAFCGAPYFLMHAFAGTIELFAFDTLGEKMPTGKVFNEFEVAQIELEEDLVTTHRDKFVFRNENLRIYLDHQFRNAHVSNAIGPDAKFPTELAPHPFIYLMAPQSVTTLGDVVSEADYINWAMHGKIPHQFNGLDLTRYIFLDQGTDYLDLGRRLLREGVVGGCMLAIDQKRPDAPIFAGQFLGYNDRSWLNQIAAPVISDTRPHYPGFGDVRPFIDTFGVAKNTVPAVSIVVVHHNRPEFLRECLSGLAAQTEKNLEIVIVDNNSDQRPDVTGFEDLRIRIVWNMNTYPGYARNLGAEIAQGEHVIFFDDDNIAKPEMVGKLLAVARRGSGDFISCFRETFINAPDGTGDEILSAPSLVHTSVLRNYLGDVVFLMRRDRFLDLKFTDYYRVGREDFEVIYAALSVDLKPGLVPEILYYYRLGNGDKIGHRHITHRTGGQKGLDFGSFRKYRRALKSYAAAKVFQLVENYHVESRKKENLHYGVGSYGQKTGSNAKAADRSPEDAQRVSMFDEQNAASSGIVAGESVFDHVSRHVRRHLRKFGIVRWFYYKMKRH